MTPNKMNDYLYNYLYNLYTLSTSLRIRNSLSYYRLIEGKLMYVRGSL